MLDVSEVGRIATAVVRMAVGATGAGVSSALTLSHADAVHVEIRNVFGRGLGLVSGNHRSRKRYRKHQKAGYS
jgi:hypothetical protein